jgi:hypothetical protein
MVLVAPRKIRVPLEINYIGSNRNTGNTDYGSKLRNLSAEAQARYKKVQDFKAEKSKFIRSEEFEGDGKIIEILDIDTKAEGKYGPTIQFAVRDPKSNRNRIWDCSSIRAAKAIDPLLEIGESLIRVWTTGVGTEKLYHAEAVDNDGSAGVGGSSGTGSRQHKSNSKDAYKKRKGTTKSR